MSRATAATQITSTFTLPMPPPLRLAARRFSLHLSMCSRAGNSSRFMGVCCDCHLFNTNVIVFSDSAAWQLTTKSAARRYRQPPVCSDTSKLCIQRGLPLNARRTRFNVLNALARKVLQTLFFVLVTFVCILKKPFLHLIAIKTTCFYLLEEHIITRANLCVQELGFKASKKRKNNRSRE